MNGKTQPAYAPEFRQQIVELYAGASSFRASSNS